MKGDKALLFRHQALHGIAVIFDQQRSMSGVINAKKLGPRVELPDVWFNRVVERPNRVTQIKLYFPSRSEDKITAAFGAIAK
jgi:hypothetical protein